MKRINSHRVTLTDLMCSLPHVLVLNPVEPLTLVSPVFKGVFSLLHVYPPYSSFSVLRTMQDSDWPWKKHIWSLCFVIPTSTFFSARYHLTDRLFRYKLDPWETFDFIVDHVKVRF